MIVDFFDVAYSEAIKAYIEGEVPVGCVIVYNNKIIATSHNLKEKYKDATAHAEILAIKEASNYLNDWRLVDCIMYSTLKPCPMCMGAILESRISKVFYLLDSVDNKKYYSDCCIKKCDNIYDEYYNLLKSFFNDIRG